ncbi:hypothetical protein [Desulfogranum japonicum]|uniref:hypothetical protein n=1 Tax=Desulfogranum japonicum TaxID=231447 RepID=UPI0003F75511|nr:hypothetical protein [Desulfogranum japonicum]
MLNIFKAILTVLLYIVFFWGEIAPLVFTVTVVAGAVIGAKVGFKEHLQLIKD